MRAYDQSKLTWCWEAERQLVGISWMARGIHIKSLICKDSTLSFMLWSIRTKNFSCAWDVETRAGLIEFTLGLCGRIRPKVISRY